jgi:hypothetical protein
MLFTSNTALPIPKKYEARTKELLREICFAEGVTKELEQWIAERIVTEENSFLLGLINQSEEHEKHSAWQVFAESSVLEKLWDEIRNPQEQIAFVEALSYLQFEAAIHDITALRKEKAAIKKFVKNIKECGLILEQTTNFKIRINSGLERMFIPSLFPILSEDKELRNSQKNTIKSCITSITENLDIVSLAHRGVFKKHDYFSLLVFSLLALVNLEMEKESYVDLKTPKSYRRTAYLKKRTKELLQQAGLTKSIDFRAKEVMEAMGWK